MRPLHVVVALCLILAVRAHPENIEDVLEDKDTSKSLDPVMVAEESKPQTRTERCTTCEGGVKIKFRSPNQILGTLRSLSGGEVHTQASFEGCSSEKGCAGIKVKDGKVIEKYGDVDAFKTAAASDINNEFTFHPAGNLPFWWMGENSPFKLDGENKIEGANAGFSKSQASFGTTGSLDLSGNPFLNGGFSDGTPKPSTFQSSFESSSSYSSSGNGELDLSGNPFLSGNKFGGSFQAQGGLGSGSQAQVGFGAGSQSQGSQGSFGIGSQAQSGFGTGSQSQGSQGSFGVGSQAQNGYGAGSQAQGSFAAGSQAQGGFGAGNQAQTGFGVGQAQGSYSQSSFNSGNKYSGSNYVGSTPRPFTASTASSFSTEQDKYEFDQQQQTQLNLEESFQSSGFPNEFQQTCAGVGFVCALKSQCFNGAVISNAVGILQSKPKKQFCNAKTEICCRLDSGAQGSYESSFGSSQTLFTSAPGASSTSYGGSASSQGYGATYETSYSSNKFGSSSGYETTAAPSKFGFGSTQSNFIDSDAYSAGSEVAGVYRPGAVGLKPGIPYLPPDNTNSGSNIITTSYPIPTYATTPRPIITPRPIYTPRPTTTPRPYRPSTSPSGYLPPHQGESSVNRETIVPPDTEGQLILDENRFPRPKPGPGPSTVPSGCAAALKCTPIEYCTAEGVMSNTTVILTRDQEAYRVPLTDCKDEAGRLGKCCRDPYYTDPWPVNQLGKWVPGVFGGNDGRYTPDSKGSPDVPRPAVTRPPVTGSTLLNNFRTTSKPVTPFGLNQVGIVGQGQYTKGGQGQYTKGGQGQYTQRGQGQFGVGTQGQFGVGTQGQFGIGSQGQFGTGTQVTGLGNGGQFGKGTQTTFGQGQIGVGQTGTQGQFGQGQIVTQTQGQGIRQGQGFGVSQGQGTSGQGQTVSQGQGFGINQGSGFGITQGSGLGISQGTGFGVSQGSGSGIVQGSGTGVSQGSGFGVSQGGGTGITQGAGFGVSQGSGSKVTQGSGFGVSQGSGSVVSQGTGFGISQGSGLGVSQGGGLGVSQGSGLGVSHGTGFGISQGSGLGVSQGTGVGVSQGNGFGVSQGSGSVISQGSGLGISQGSGFGVSQGGGSVVSQGSGLGVSQGSGLGVSQGTGFGVSQGGGFGVTQGGGLGVTQGQGFGVTPGVGIGVTTGEGVISSQGTGFGVSSGQGQYVSQGQGFGVSQGFGQGFTTGQGQLISQGFGTGIRGNQNSALTQSKETDVENEFGESVQRVFLKPYNAGGECGVPHPQKPYGDRNDLEVDFAEIPWQAMVLLQTNKSLLCGGVITRPDVVLTSASCVEGLDAKNVLIKGGEWKLGIDDEPLPFQIVQVKHILRHPFFKPGSLQYDAAVLVLSEDLRLAKNIYPICLPGEDQGYEDLYSGVGECIVTGWGKIVLQAHLQGAIMHSINVSLITPDQCQNKISQDFPHLLEQYDEDSCVCGEPNNPVNNICKVDIGSALACTTGDSHYVMRGIYSWDSGCQAGNQLAAFYKFDVEWYEWCIGLKESQRFSKYSIGAKVTQNKYTQTIQSSGVKGQFTGIKGGIKGFTQFGQKQENKPDLDQFNQFGQFTGKFTENNGDNIDLGGQLRPPISNTFSATYTEKKVYQSEPKIISYTTKPEIVTFTTKPEIFTFTTKPKIVTYTTKPEIFTYTTKPKIVTYTTKPEIVTFTTKPEFFTFTTKPQYISYSASATDEHPAYAIPGVSFKENLSDYLGHKHTPTCKCLEGKK